MEQKLFRELLVNTVRTNRKALKLTQAQLAQKIGIHRAIIRRIENREYLPNVEQLEVLGETLYFEVVDFNVKKRSRKKSHQRNRSQ